MRPMILLTGAHFPVSMIALYGDITLADVDAMRAFYRDMHARQSRFAVFSDSRHCRAPSASIRRALTEMSNEFDEQSKKNAVCTAIVMDSPLLIGVLTAL